MTGFVPLKPCDQDYGGRNTSCGGCQCHGELCDLPSPEGKVPAQDLPRQSGLEFAP